MLKLFVLFSTLLLIFVSSALGQNECSNFPKKFDMSKCCEPPRWDETDTAKDCDKSANVFCYAECVLNATNSIINGQVNSANVKSVFEKELKRDPDYIPIAIQAFEMCYPMVKQRMGDKNIKIGGCSILSANSIECTNTQLFVNCPAKRWKTSPECEDLKAYFKKCPIRNAPTVNK